MHSQGSGLKNVTTEKLVELYNSGLSTHKLAKMFKGSQSRMYLRLFNAGVKFRQGVGEDTSLKIAQLYKDGVKVREIAEQTGVSIETIYRHLKRHRVTRRNRSGKSPEGIFGTR